ncbi:MAG TPA: hypothetical protein PK264_10875 [Hyphomicrobiaceae bacterium]|nr:hypothetical protein [Hyphomicrobiaceae bacterium]
MIRIEHVEPLNASRSKFRPSGIGFYVLPEQVTLIRPTRDPNVSEVRLQGGAVYFAGASPAALEQALLDNARR